VQGWPGARSSRRNCPVVHVVDQVGSDPYEVGRRLPPRAEASPEGPGRAKHGWRSWAEDISIVDEGIVLPRVFSRTWPGVAREGMDSI